MNAIARLQAAPQTNLMRSPATIAFVQDEATRTLLADLLEPGAAQISPGGIEEAITYLVHDPSSRTVLVDLSATDQPLVALDRLAEVCLPGTRVIALGDVNDIHFYRVLRSAGVADYLVKPLTADMVGLALMDPPAQRSEAPVVPETPKIDGEVIVVAGARGGVGATMVAVSLACLSGERSGRRTVLTDLDLMSGTASLALDVEPGHGLSEALASPNRIDTLLLAGATARVGESLYVLSSEQSLDNAVSVQPDAVERLVDGLRQGFERVILDVPRSDPGVLRQALAQAGALVIVTDFSLAGVRDTGRLIALAEKVAPTAKRLVVANRFCAIRKGDLTRADIEKALGLTLSCVIPEDGAAVSHAINAGKPVPAAFPASPSAAALRELVTCLDAAPRRPSGGLLGRLLGAILKKGGS